MDFLLQSIQITADIADGWTVGTVVIEDGQTYMQLDNGAIIPASGSLEVRNGDIWQKLTQEDAQAVTAEGWPAYAGMRARMR